MTHGERVQKLIGISVATYRLIGAAAEELGDTHPLIERMVVVAEELFGQELALIGSDE
jgi:hypothetical protein